MNIYDLDTPALIIENSVLERNIRAMQDHCNLHKVNLRPHIKTHKTPAIASMQLQAGAVGIACAKLSEAEVFADHGFDDIQIANLIIGESKLQKLQLLHTRLKNLSVLADSAEGVQGLASHFNDSGHPLDVLIKTDIGYGRCGLSKTDEIIRLADMISSQNGLKLKGITTHAGQAYSARSSEEIAAIGYQEGRRMAAIAEELQSKGFPVESVTVGSNPTALYSSTIEGVTEIRTGNYIFNDMIQVSLGTVGIERCALSVLTTVISKPAVDRVIIDAGSKTFSSDKGAHGNDTLKGMGYILGKDSYIAKFSEEHGIIYGDSSKYSIGEQLRVIPNHACTTMNLHDSVYLADGEKVLDKFEISARGKLT